MEQLLLLCRALSSPTICRFIPALSVCPLLFQKNQERSKGKNPGVTKDKSRRYQKFDSNGEHSQKVGMYFFRTNPFFCKTF